MPTLPRLGTRSRRPDAASTLKAAAVALAVVATAGCSGSDEPSRSSTDQPLIDGDSYDVVVSEGSRLLGAVTYEMLVAASSQPTPGKAVAALNAALLAADPSLKARVSTVNPTTGEPICVAAGGRTMSLYTQDGVAFGFAEAPTCATAPEQAVFVVELAPDAEGTIITSVERGVRGVAAQTQLLQELANNGTLPEYFYE